MPERCGYCGRFMAYVDYGLEFGTEWVCSQQFEHIVADPEHWSIGSLDMAVRVAKARAGLDPDQTHPPASFIDHLDEKWRQPFWERQIDRATDKLSRAFGSHTGSRPQFTAESEGDDYLFGPPPDDRYRGVRALFNGDMHLLDPSYAPREDWIVVDAQTIEHVRPVGQR